MRRHLLYIVAALVSAPVLAGEELTADGLPDAATVATALDEHPTVVAARARTEAARAEAQALGAGPHEFTMTGSYTRRTVDREGQFNEFDVLVTRPVRLPGKASLDKEIGRYGVEAAENRAEDAKHQAALLLSQYWWDWVGAAAEAAVDRELVKNNERLVLTAQRRAALGDASRLEVDQAEAALGAARLTASQSAGREQVARARLAAQFPSLPLPEVAPVVPSPVLPAGGLEQFRDLIVSNSHEVAAAEAEANRSHSVAERVRRDRIADPSIGFRAFSERGGMERGGGLVVTMPFGGSHRSALADRAAAESSAADAELQATRYAILETADADLAEAEYRYSAWQRSREGLAAQVAALTKMRRGYEAGEVELTDLLFAERQVGDAFRAEATARVEAQRALTKLRIDSHELWLRD